MRLYVYCEKSGGLNLAELDLTADWLTEFRQGLKFFKPAVYSNIQFSAEGTALFQQCFCHFFHYHMAVSFSKAI